MNPLKYYNFKNSLEITEMLGAEAYHFKAMFNGGFISGMYSYRFNAIVDPIFGEPLAAEEKNEITGVLKTEVERLRELEDKAEILRKQEDESERLEKLRRLRERKDLE